MSTEWPSDDELKQTTEQLAHQAVTPFLKAAFRRRILEIRAQNEQTIDRHSIDDVLYAGFDASAVEKAQTKVKDFRAWIAAHKDELTALQVLYAGTKSLKISLKDLRQLRDAPGKFSQDGFFPRPEFGNVNRGRTEGDSTMLRLAR